MTEMYYIKEQLLINNRNKRNKREININHFSRIAFQVPTQKEWQRQCDCKVHKGRWEEKEERKEKKKKREEKRRVRQSRLTFSTTRCGALRDGKITRTDSTETKRNNRLVHFWTTPRECSHFIISRSVLKAAFLFSDQVRIWSPTRSLPHHPYSFRDD